MTGIRLLIICLNQVTYYFLLHTGKLIRELSWRVEWNERKRGKSSGIR